MGNSDSRLYKAPTLKHQSWREGTLQRQTKAEQGRFRVLVNKLTSEELEEYLLAFHSLAEFQRYLQFFQWREREDSVVNAKYLNYKLGSDFCATSYTASVYIQRIPVRLSDIEDIPFPQNLYLLLTALDGFEKLYRIVGYFRPTEDLICMDRDGRVKAWLHSDLSCSLPAGCSPEEAGLRRQETLEARMVQEIVRLVEDNTSHDPEQPLTVTDYLRRNHRTRPLTFKQAREDILSYAQELHADIPNYFESVVGIFDQEPSHNDEQSAQPRSSLHNPQSSHPNAEQLEFRGNVEHWNRNEPRSQHLEERPTEKGSEHSRQRVNGAPPMQNYMRPNTVAYSLVNPPSHYPPYQQYRPQPMSSVFASSPKVLFNYQPQQQPLPPPPLFLPYNIQSLPLQHLPTPQPHQNYINPVSPISQLVSPALVIKKATSVQPQESDRTHPQQKFDAKLVLSSSLKHLLSANNRLVYSDSTSTYQLDEELAEDMVKYLTET